MPISIPFRIAGLATAALVCGLCTEAVAAPRLLYVSAQAWPGGNGTRAQPFNSLAAVEQASAPGDTIVVLPAPDFLPSLNGGIALKPGQTLLGETGPAGTAARVTNSTGLRHGGHAVVLAANTTVAGLSIAKPWRSGIYGRNTSGVDIHDNDVSGHNVSCTPGLIIQPVVLPLTIPGVVIPQPLPLPNGWAGIMIDADQGSGSGSIRNNTVRDADCGDGIDLRMRGNAIYQAQVIGNTVSRLKQGSPLRAILSVLAIGMQTLDQSRLEANLDGNFQHDIGDASLVTDSEGVFANIDGTSTLIADVDHNEFVRGSGGFSANAMELVISGGSGTASMRIRNSSFKGVPGDVLEQLNFGTGSRSELILDNVTAADAYGSPVLPVLIDPVSQAGNLGDCLVVTSAGAGNTTTLSIRDSVFTNCVHNGLSISSNTLVGSGPASLISFDIDNSAIIANHGYNLRLINVAPVTQLRGKVQNTNLGGAGNVNLRLEDKALQAGNIQLDFGGGALGSTGGNCFYGGVADLQILGVNASLENNWWGSSAGPQPGRIRIGTGSADYFPALTAAPSICRTP